MDIETGIPIPGRKGSGQYTERLRVLKVKQSRFFLAEDEGLAVDSLARSIGQAARYTFGSGNYVTRTMEEKGKLGVRVWRTG